MSHRFEGGKTAKAQQIMNDVKVKSFHVRTIVWQTEE